MKNYNKILEAVNRGIQLALDDFDDEEQVQHVKSKQVQNRDYTKEYLDLMNDVVDLGLPSETLWCKYNLDVDPNQLNTPEDWYGKYYAWGEIKPNKPEFSWSTYKYAEHYTDLFESECLTKYCNDPQKGYNQITKRPGFTDNLTELLQEDDAAYQNKKLHNYKFHMPTKEQCKELINYTSNYWVNNYDPNKTIHNQEDDKGIKGLNGIIFEGKNKNQLFIPAAGYRDGSGIHSVSYCCDLWSMTLCTSNSIDANAYEFYLSPFDIETDDIDRYYGFTVRPVINL